MYQVPAPITMASASEVLAEGTVAIEAGETTFSLGLLAGSDSSAIAVLLSWQRRSARAGHSLQFTDIPAALISFATLYGVDSFLPGFPVGNATPSTHPARKPAAPAPLASPAPDSSAAQTSH